MELEGLQFFFSPFTLGEERKEREGREQEWKITVLFYRVIQSKETKKITS